LVTGRRTFDIANAWGGRHPVDAPVFVVTHTVPREWVYEGSPFTIVTDGVESAVEKAKEAAGDRDIGVGAASIAQQCIQAGILDEIQIHLAPVLLGDGIRLFDHQGAEPIDLESMRVVEAPGVTHLRFRVVKDG
jgi:dihydrofolate reductase